MEPGTWNLDVGANSDMAKFYNYLGILILAFGHWNLDAGPWNLELATWTSEPTPANSQSKREKKPTAIKLHIAAPGALATPRQTIPQY